MAKKKVTMPVVEQTSEGAGPSNIQAVLNATVNAAQQEQQAVHEVTRQIADMQVNALLPYLRGEVLNTMVVQGLANQMGALPEVVSEAAAQPIVQMFEDSCEARAANIETHTGKAIALLQGWQSEADERHSAATLMLNAGDDFDREQPEYGSAPQLEPGENDDEGVIEGD